MRTIGIDRVSVSAKMWKYLQIADMMTTAKKMIT